MVLTVQMTFEVPQLQLFFYVADVLVMHIMQVPQVQVVVLTCSPVPGAGRGNDSRVSGCHVTCLTALVSVSTVLVSVDTSLVSEDTALVSEDTPLVSEDTALVSVESPLVSEDTALVSVDTALVSENTALVSVESALVSVDTALVSVDAALVWAVRSVARGDTTGVVLGQGLGHYDKCRGLLYAFRREVPQVQLIFKDVDFPVVAQRLFPWSRLFSCSLRFSQLPYTWWLVSRLCSCFTCHRCSSECERRCIHTATSSSSSLGPFIDLSVGSV